MPTEPSFIRGLFVPILRDLERAQISPESWEAFLATLSPDCPWRRVPRPDDWVSVLALHECIEAFIAWTGIEPRRVRGEVVADMMYGALPPDPSRTPADFFRGIHEFWEDNAKGIHMTIENLLGGLAHVRVEANAPDPEWFHLTVLGWFRRAVTLHGGRDVAIESQPGVDGTRYFIRWVD